MINKIKKSLAFRLPTIYKQLLKHKTLITTSKPSSGSIVITMTGKSHIELTRLSVFSIAKNWTTLPKLFVYNDGSLTNKEIEQTLSVYKGELIVSEWSLVKDHHQKLNRNALINYAEENPFGKKMALILYHAAQHPVIWIDSDILFFQDFIKHLPEQVKDSVCGGSEDWLQAFDYRIVEALNSKFNTHYKFNAGMLYVCGNDIYEKFNLEELLNSIHPNYDFLTEQTIFAHIASNSLGVFWKQKVLKNFCEDNQLLTNAGINKTIARHYVSNVRHLFWRDAFLHLVFK